MTSSFQGGPPAEFELRFVSLFSGRALSFPCDSEGRVDLETLSKRSQDNYLTARALIGREYAYPEVVPVSH